MTYVITQPCCNDAACVDVCPVDCIHPRPGAAGFDDAEMLHIDPDACVDCGACVEVCPADAIVADHEMRGEDHIYLNMARVWFADHPATGDGRPFAAPSSIAGDHGLLRVAIVGTGPAACYAARALLAIEGLRVHISMFDRLPVFGGLVRYGVAPDHARTKGVAEVFERELPDDAVDFFLNVEIGTDLTHEEILRSHHAVIYAAFASGGRRLGVPGEDLAGSCTASEFVGWYNGHPDHAGLEFDFSASRAVIVGNGNVALDVARILVSPPERLAASDIAENARLALKASRIEEVVILGRRGPAETAGTTPELLALADIPGVDVLVETDSEISVSSRKTALLAIWAKRSPRPGNRRIVLRYQRSPVAIEGDARVEGVRLNDGRIACGLVVSSLGFRGEPQAGLPFDEVRGATVHERGRVADGLYVAGWMKRGPSGVIGTNKRCSAETVASLVADFAEGRLREPTESAAAFRALVTQRQPDWIGRDGWREIDRFERASATGSRRGRVKLIDRGEMLAIARANKIQTVV